MKYSLDTRPARQLTSREIAKLVGAQLMYVALMDGNEAASDVAAGALALLKHSAGDVGALGRRVIEIIDTTGHDPRAADLKRALSVPHVGNVIACVAGLFGWCKHQDIVDGVGWWTTDLGRVALRQGPDAALASLERRVHPQA